MLKKYLKHFSYGDRRRLTNHLFDKGHKKPKSWKLIHSEACCDNELDTNIPKLLKKLAKEHGFSLDDKDYFAIDIVSNPNEVSRLDKGEFKVRYKYGLRWDKRGEPKIKDNTREFCEKLIKANKIFRREDIDMMSFRGSNPISKINYSIFRLKGHWNCRHAWIREVYVQIKDKNNIENNPIFGKKTTLMKNKKIKMAIAAFDKQMAGDKLTKNDIVLVNEMLLGKQEFVDAKVDDKILRIDGDEIAVGATVSWIDEAGEVSDVDNGDYTLADEGKVVTVMDGAISEVTDIEAEAEEGEAEETELTVDEKFTQLEEKLTSTVAVAIEKLTNSLDGKFTNIEKTIADIPALEAEEIKQSFNSNIASDKKRVSVSTPFVRPENN